MGLNDVFVVIGQDPNTKDFWYQQRENDNGKPGKVSLLGDGKGDVRPMINNYVKKGYDPAKIIYNGQPVTDVFTKTTDNNGAIVFKGEQNNIVKNSANPQVKQVITTSDGQKVVIPVMLGCDIRVEALDDGTYKVLKQAVVYPKPEPKIEIMTEKELIEAFGRYSNLRN